MFFRCCAIFVFAVGFCYGCSPQRLMVDQMIGVLESGMAAVEQDDDIELLQQAFPAQIKQMEGLLVSAPDNDRLLILLSKAYAAYAYIYMDAELENMRLLGRGAGHSALALRRKLNRYYVKGMEYALRAMETAHPQCRPQLASTSEIDAFLTTVKADDVPALFWYAFNLSAHVNANLDSIRSLAKGPGIERIMQRVIALDETYYHGMAHLVLLAYYGSRSPAMGGDLAKAEMHYRRSKTITRDQLWLTEVYHARYVLVHRQERQHYVERLQDITGRFRSDPAYRLLNRAAQKRAHLYLELTDRLFL